MSGVQQLVDPPDGIQGAAVFTIGILLRLEIHIEDRLQHQHGCCLRDSISHCRYAQRPLLPIRLGDIYSPYRKRLIGSTSQLFRQFVQPTLPAVFLDVLESLLIHSRGAAIEFAAHVGEGPAHPLGTLCRTAHRNENWAIPSLYRATPSATSEHLVGLLDSSSIPRSFVVSCVSFQLRPLPSTGITRLRRYYEPLRHPIRPGLSLASCQFDASPLGLPVLRCFPLLACRRQYPGRSNEGSRRSYSSTVSGLPSILGGSAPASPVSGPAQRSLTLRPTRSPSRLSDPLHQRLRQFRYLHCRFGCYRAERSSSRVGLAPTVKQRLFTAHEKSRLIFLSCPPNVRHWEP